MKKKKISSKTYFKIFLVAILVIGLSAGIKLSLQTQNMDQQAKVSDGPVQIFTSYTPAQALSPATLDFYINTQGNVVEGIQLGLTLMTPQPNSLQNVQATINPQSGLSEIQPPLFVHAPDGLSTKILFAAVSKQALEGQLFSTTTNVKFASIQFTPSADFSVKVEFDQVLSKVTHLDESGEVNDLLAPISNFEITDP